jgi:site-specific recombinase XerD
VAGRDLSRVKDREVLRPTPKAEPYWQRLRPGCFLGYSPSAKGGDGSWLARAYDPDAGRYQKKHLGAFPHVPGSAKFTAAKLEAERFAAIVEAGGRAEEKIDTVADACRAYAKDRPEAGARFARYVYDDPIARVQIDKLRRRHLEDWRARLSNQPSLVSRSKDGERRTRDRAPSTVNRDMAVLRAALNRVLSPGTPSSEAAWQEALRANVNADGRRTLYLDRDQRRRLLEHIDTAAAPFVRALCLLPMRPGAMAALDAGAFDKRTSELTIGKDKTGKPRRIVVPADASSLLASQLPGKLPTSPLFMRANGERWNKDSWKQPIARAVAIAGLPSGATAYTLRHSTITDLVTAGLPLLTIAQISGTSAEMIERHYGHLASAAATKALAGLAL